MTPPVSLTEILANLRAPATTGSTVTSSIKVSHRSYGAPGEHVDMVLLHAGAANAHWWDHLAPTLARGRRVVAVDLSGHGLSEWRDSYSYDEWAGEVIDVCHGEALRAPIVVGHSMGGKVALRTAELFGEHLSGVLVLDTPMRRRTASEQARLDRLSGTRKLYASRGEAIASFRLAPPANSPPQAVMEHLADTSVVQVGTKWGWRFDPRIYSRDGAERLGSLPVACPITLVRAQYGALDSESARSVASAMGNVAIVEFAGVGHHMILDDPVGSLTLIADVARTTEEGEWGR